MNVLELGNYIAPAYAGMILAEQGHNVEKWIGQGADPIQGLRRGTELWHWINHGKTVRFQDAAFVARFNPCVFDIVIDNFRPEFWNSRGVDRGNLARRLGLVWVSLESECGDTSFDALAQARSWMEYAPYVPFYVGDTTAGLWMAFKALATRRPGHYPIGHASCMQKLVEGELMIDEPRGTAPPWDEPGTYGFDGWSAIVKYKGREYSEPVRDRAWKLANLRHRGGRITI